MLNRMQLIWLGKEKSDLTRTRSDRISKGKELRGRGSQENRQGMAKIRYQKRGNGIAVRRIAAVKLCSAEIGRCEDSKGDGEARRRH